MKAKHEDLLIPKKGEGDPFENCKLERKQYADILTDIVSAYSDGFVLAVNNKWGTGKTTFIKMWQQYLRNKEYKTLYFNAWENDFEKDVLVALLAEIEVLRDPKTEGKFKSLLTKATPLMKALGVGLTKGLSKKVGLDGVTEVIFDGIEKEINSYATKKKGIQDFRNSLEAYVELIAKDKPVIFIIDELDRCRPNYAVEVLECVKHLFSVKGIVFVLSIDKEQLGHAVRGVYGSDKIDADEYLRRFIDLEYSIPEPNMGQMVNYLYEYYSFSDFLDTPERGKQRQNEGSDLKKHATILVKNSGFTLRKLDKQFAMMRVALKSYKKTQSIIPELTLMLSFLRIENDEIFNGLKDKKYELQELIKLVEEAIKIDTEDNNVNLAYVIFMLGVSYHNYLNEYKHPSEELPIIKNDSNDIIGVTFKSKIIELEGEGSLISIFGSSRIKYSLSSISLKEPLSKIMLLNPIEN